VEKTAWLPLGRHRPNTLPKRAAERRVGETGGRGERIEDISKDRRSKEERTEEERESTMRGTLTKAQRDVNKSRWIALTTSPTQRPPLSPFITSNYLSDNTVPLEGRRPAPPCSSLSQSNTPPSHSPHSGKTEDTFTSKCHLKHVHAATVARLLDGDEERRTFSGSGRTCGERDFQNGLAKKKKHQRPARSDGSVSRGVKMTASIAGCHADYSRVG